MSKTCFCCGKEVKFLDFDLQNGKICDDCLNKAMRENGKINRLNISKYSGEEIVATINQDEEALAHPENFAPHESKADRLVKQGEKVHFAVLKWVFIILVFIFVVFSIINSLK